MSNRKEVIDALQQFFAGGERFFFLNGTHQYEKHKLVLAAAFEFSSAPSTVLFRTNSKGNTGTMLADVGIQKVPQPGAYLAVNGHRLFTDTINPVSWRKSPSPVDVAVVYPVDSMKGDDASDCAMDLVRRQAKKILLVTWTDNVDFGWVDQFKPKRATYDAAEEQPDYHERVQEVEAETTRTDLPKSLPAYAKRGDETRLIKIHCRGCNATRWAELNVPYPGKAALRSSGANFVATCLKCGRQHTDNYNWYGRD